MRFLVSVSKLRYPLRTLSISGILPEASEALTMLINIGLKILGYSASTFEKFSPFLTASARLKITILNPSRSACSPMASSASLSTTPASSITDSCVVNSIRSSDFTLALLGRFGPAWENIAESDWRALDRTSVSLVVSGPKPA